jgi:tetratricopeptide (TPR) repeat protein
MEPLFLSLRSVVGIEMKFKPVIALSLSSLILAGSVLAQNATPPAPTPTPVPTPKLSDQLAKALERPSAPVSREQREKAYAKLLEGQRFIWSSDRLRSVAARQSNVKLAQQSFRESVVLDPSLSEGYTALAEVALNGQPQDIEEAIRLSQLAAKVNPNNFGARRILARLYTFQTHLVNGRFNPELAQKAITEWKQVTRLDPRNAEAWALLSELYDRTNQSNETIDSLKKWLAAAAPVDTRFYQMLMGGASLAPENASMKLGTALIKAGRMREAIETLSILVADDPENYTAVDMLREAIEGASNESASIAVESLKQAVYANPNNVSLLNLLAQVQARSGKIDDATKLLKDTSARLMPTDRASASVLQVTLGDLLNRSDRQDEAIRAYEAALVARGLDGADVLADDEREFAVHVFTKMIQTLKAANKVNEAKGVIERARKMLGSDDMFADRELISLLRESGNRTEALAAVKAVRTKLPNDYGFIRLEATLLAETGRVDEGVALIKGLIDKVPAAPPVTTSGAGSPNEMVTIAVPASDAFSNYLFISNLYAQANRGKEAVSAANQAYSVARGSERKQIARLTLASAQQMSGDFAGAEATLRELLKETPGNPIALNNLGYFLLERNDRVAEAFDLIQQAVKIDPTNPSYLDSLGWAYFRLGRLNEAETSLREALRIDSGSGTIHEHLGDVYQKQGKLDLAKSSWMRAASLFSEATDLARVKQKLVSAK